MSGDIELPIWWAARRVPTVTASIGRDHPQDLDFALQPQAQSEEMRDTPATAPWTAKPQMYHVQFRPREPNRRRSTDQMESSPSNG